MISNLSLIGLILINIVIWGIVDVIDKWVLANKTFSISYTYSVKCKVLGYSQYMTMSDDKSVLEIFRVYGGRVEVFVKVSKVSPIILVSS